MPIEIWIMVIAGALVIPFSLFVGRKSSWVSHGGSNPSLATIKKPPNSGGFFISYFSASALYAVSIRARYFSTAARSSSFMSSRIVSLALIKGMILCHALATD